MVVLRIAARWSADRYLRYGLAAAALVAFVAYRLSGHDSFAVGYWCTGFAFGVVIHEQLKSQRRTAPK
jgi:hypothetical protein